ncbi:hypothetical protein MXB_259 [Myxobolus squamalis]|nr:hypothetical protein MXB_259 [Myxobolus squamalis]
MTNQDVNSSVVLVKFKEIVGLLYLDASNVLVIHRDGCTSYSIHDKEIYTPVYSISKNNHSIIINKIHFNFPFNLCPPFLSNLSVPSTSNISETVKTLFENLKIDW